ncbi:B-cell receptor CD22-like [Clinocottus analis]|uniref:B-cell receptor CD22-like n=1 Tax=Clinocottus analis TaxID=304258 RepID=UPI0035C25E36
MHQCDENDCSLRITDLTEIDSAEYKLMFLTKQPEDKYSGSPGVTLSVTDAPKLPSVSVSPSGEIVEGSSVNLTCSSDANPAASYTWYKEDEDSPKASGHIFTITDFRDEHSGNYSCEAQNTRGRSNSTLYLITMSGSLTAAVLGAAVGSAIAVFLALMILAAFLLIRRRRSSNQTSKPAERPDTNTQIAPVEEDLCYASVNFSKYNEELLYSNAVAARPRRRKEEELNVEEEEEEEEVTYTSVQFKSASAANKSRRQEAVDDSALYSSVIKPPRG